MDPAATLRMCREQIDSGNWIEALYYLLEYYKWRMRRGVEPFQGDGIAEGYEFIIIDNLSK